MVMEDQAIVPDTIAPISAPASLADLCENLSHLEGFDTVLEALENNRSATIDGTWGSSAGLVASALARNAPQTVLVVIAHPREVDAWAADLESFSGHEPVILP